MNTFRKGQEVFNTVSGQCGSIVGTWTNIGGQTVLNVRVNGMAASWNIAETDLFSHEDTPRSPAGGGNPEAVEVETLDAEYCLWLDFLAANQPLEDDPLYFEPYVWEVERSEDSYQFHRALSQLEDAIVRWQDGQ